MMTDNPELEISSADFSEELALPFADHGVRAGFPSPAQDSMSESIDLNRELVHHPATTFYARVIGDSMLEAGIEAGDILVIDRSLEPANGDMVVAFIDGEFTLKYIKKDKDCLWLQPANDRYSPIKVTAENDFTVWGVVTYSIKKRRKIL